MLPRDGLSIRGFNTKISALYLLHRGSLSPQSVRLAHEEREDERGQRHLNLPNPARENSGSRERQSKNCRREGDRENEEACRDQRSNPSLILGISMKLIPIRLGCISWRRASGLRTR